MVSNQNFFSPDNDQETTKKGFWDRPRLGLILCLSLLSLTQVGFDLEAWYGYQSQIEEVGGVVPMVTQVAPRWGAIFELDEDVKWLVGGVTAGFDFDFAPPP